MYPPARHQIVAKVNIDHVLETAHSSFLQVGTWINVVGYITKRSPNPVYQSLDFGNTPVYSEVTVQAVVMWPTEALSFEQYEKGMLHLTKAANPAE